jgi:sigma-B regulation protein RsbU (phosphoserine phosphatase)
VAIPPGSVLCLFTDGLVERRGQPLDEGIARMLRSVTAAQPDSLWTAIMNEIDGGRGSPG